MSAFRSMLFLMITIIIFPSPTRAEPCSEHVKITGGTVAPCDAVGVPAVEFLRLLREETRATKLDAVVLTLEATILELKADLRAALGAAEAERLGRIACAAASNAAARCSCDIPWGGWTWVAGLGGLALGGLSGYGLARVLP